MIRFKRSSQLVTSLFKKRRAEYGSNPWHDTRPTATRLYAGILDNPHNSTTNFRLLYQSKAESSSPFSVFNNNPFFNFFFLLFVTAFCKETHIFENILITSFSIKSISFSILSAISVSRGLLPPHSD